MEEMRNVEKWIDERNELGGNPNRRRLSTFCVDGMVYKEGAMSAQPPPEGAIPLSLFGQRTPKNIPTRTDLVCTAGKLAPATVVSQAL